MYIYIYVSFVLHINLGRNPWKMLESVHPFKIRKLALSLSYSNKYQISGYMSVDVKEDYQDMC